MPQSPWLHVACQSKPRSTGQGKPARGFLLATWQHSGRMGGQSCATPPAEATRWLPTQAHFKVSSDASVTLCVARWGGGLSPCFTIEAKAPFPATTLPTLYCAESAACATACPLRMQDHTLLGLGLNVDNNDRLPMCHELGCVTPSSTPAKAWRTVCAVAMRTASASLFGDQVRWGGFCSASHCLTPKR